MLLAMPTDRYKLIIFWGNHRLKVATSVPHASLRWISPIVWRAHTVTAEFRPSLYAMQTSTNQQLDTSNWIGFWGRIEDEEAGAPGMPRPRERWNRGDEADRQCQCLFCSTQVLLFADSCFATKFQICLRALSRNLLHCQSPTNANWFDVTNQREPLSLRHSCQFICCSRYDHVRHYKCSEFKSCPLFFLLFSCGASNISKSKWAVDSYNPFPMTETKQLLLPRVPGNGTQEQAIAQQKLPRGPETCSVSMLIWYI